MRFIGCVLTELFACGLLVGGCSIRDVHLMEDGGAGGEAGTDAAASAGYHQTASAGQVSRAGSAGASESGGVGAGGSAEAESESAGGAEGGAGGSRDVPAVEGDRGVSGAGGSADGATGGSPGGSGAGGMGGSIGSAATGGATTGGTATGGAATGGATTGGTATGGAATGGAATGGVATGGAATADPCDENPCQNGGSCVPDGESYRCECTGGYAGATCTRLIFTPIEPVSGATGSCVANGVSGNGMVVVGSCLSDAGGTSIPYRWESGTTTELPAVSGNAYAMAVDANGIKVVGWTETSTVPRAASWMGTTVDVAGYGLGPANVWTRAYDVSADGRYLLGNIAIAPDITDPQAYTAEAARWDSTATSASPSVIYPGSVYLGASVGGISADGQVASLTDMDFWSPYVWTTGGGAFWDAESDACDALYHCSALSISGDGLVVVGAIGSQAFRWDGVGVSESLGVSGAARAANIDGSIIVGGAGSAWVWSEALGVEVLSTALSEAGVDLTGWSLTSANDISSDGTVIVGTGVRGGLSCGFYVDILETGIAGM